MQFHIAEPNSNLAIGAVWSNHSDGTKLIVLGGLNELKDFIVSWDENIAFLEVSFILNHTYKVAQKCRKVKLFFHLPFDYSIAQSCRSFTYLSTILLHNPAGGAPSGP